MNVAAAPPDVDAAEAAGHWQAALALIRKHFGRWQKGRRLTRSAPDYVEPRPFCDALLAEALSHRSFLAAAERAAFFRWACAQPGIKALLPVLAGHDLLARGDNVEALVHLEQALILDQEDLYAQELWFAARGEPIGPVDPAKRMCPNPFERIESASRNRLMFCCPAWLPVPAGSLDDDTVEAVWNSPAAQDIRASIHDGSYRYCSRMHCPMFTDDDLPHVADIRNRELRHYHETRETRLPPKIQRISLAHDRSCNISCPSCRKSVIMADRSEVERLDALTDKALLPLIMNSRRVVITGSGDPFASKHYRNVIRRITALPPGPKIDLQTHGLLLARSWEELSLEGRVGKVLCSIDAAAAETYEVVRRGGKFADLLENLGFLSELRKRGAVEEVRLDFVVQALNFREMPDAVRLMREHGFDGIKFQMLRSWNTWSEDDFRRHHVGHPGHPDHAELQAILRDPVLAGDDVLWFGFYSMTPRSASGSGERSAPASVASNGEARQASSLA